MVQSLENFPYTDAQKKQLKWRQKQLDIFYNTGRPIYGVYKHGRLIQPLLNNLHFFKQ